MYKNMKNLGIGLLAVLVVVIFILGPFVTIWSINTLFGLAIDYTFWTWLAMVWLSFVTFGNVVGAINRKG